MFRSLLNTGVRLCDRAKIGNLVIKRCAGHSKWQNIKHIKGQKDAERAKFFTKLAQFMKVAIRGMNLYNIIF